MTCASPVMRRQSFEATSRISAGTYATVYEHQGRIALKASSNLRASAGLDGDVDTNSEHNNLGETANELLRRAELIEAMILRRFSLQKHANVACADQIFFDSYVQNVQFSLVLQLDLATGSLVEFMTKKGKDIDEQMCKRFLKQIANGIDALHQHKICHGDLKPGNILVKTTADDRLFDVVLADFGLSTMPLFAVHGHAAETYTFGHVAPECCDGFQTEPALIRNTAEAQSILCSFSCFADPLSSQSTLGADETLSEESGAPRQANRFRFQNVTKATTASDIWAFGSIAIFLFSRGKHPINKHCFQWIDDVCFSSQETHIYRACSRLQLSVWYVFLKQHQKRTNWQLVFDFEAVSNDFKAYMTRMYKKEFSFDSDSTLDTLELINSTGLDLVYSCLQFLPTERPEIADICEHAFFSEQDESAKRGRKRSNGQIDSIRKKLRNTKTSMSSFLVSRCCNSRPSLRLPFYQETVQMLLKVSTVFGFSLKSILLACNYFHLVVPNLDKRKSMELWTKNFCFSLAVTCLLIAVSLFEVRHEVSFDIIDLVQHFAEEYNFKHAHIAKLQRTVAEILDFEFDIPTVAHVIDLALCETETFHLMPKTMLVSKVLSLLQTSEAQFFASQTIPLALALLKRFDCTAAFEKLLCLSGRHRSSVDMTLKLID